MGGCGGFKTNLNKKVGGIRAIFFLYNLHPDSFFFQLEGKAGREKIQANLKNSGRVGTWVFLPNIYF